MPQQRTVAAPVAVFDLDGTLIDTAPDLMAALNGVLAGVGLPPVTLEDTKGIVGQGARAMIERALRQLGEPVGKHDIDALFQSFLVHYEAHIAVHSRPYPGLMDALDELADRGFVLAVCTNKLESLARQLLDELEMTARFAAIVGGGATTRSKPAPDPLLLAVDQAGGGKAVMIGDSIADAGSARAAGVPCILVDFGYTDRPAHSLGADLVISHFDALIAGIDSLLGGDAAGAP
ncbi:MAG: HAD family hydrolase [Pseudomonadota bacterium]